MGCESGCNLQLRRKEGEVICMSSEMSLFAKTIMEQKYSHVKPDGTPEAWGDIAKRVAENVMGAVSAPKDLVDGIREAIAAKKLVPAGRYLYAAGRPYHQTQNCLLLSAEDSREGWADLLRRASMALMTGAGIGIEYSRIRQEGEVIKKTGGYATGPIALMQMVNEVSRGVMQGGSRRSAVLAMLSWKHADVYKFIVLKNWTETVRELKGKDMNFPATMDGTNISVQLDDEFFEAFHNKEHALHSHASSVYWAIIEQMLKTGEPGFTVDIGINHGESLRNACGEATSSEDNDICNLGSVNMANIHSMEEMKNVVELGVALLLAGTVYSDTPYEEVRIIREKNRRLGLGLMGLHEWLLLRSKRYGPDAELEEYLKIYADNMNIAIKYADMWGLSRPVKVRALAPTGTVGIVMETTTGIEPIFCAAYKRRYRKGSHLIEYQYVLDPTAKKLVGKGINPDLIEDAYTLSKDVERRVAFQAWLQQFVDQGISSTINLPAWGTEQNNHDKVVEFGNMLMKYLPRLRGITAYPDGARSGQPLTPVKFQTAAKHIGQVFVESADVCDITRGGTCSG